jgi:hypothetical protein
VNKLSLQQRKHIADKLADTANLALGGLVFAQAAQGSISTLTMFGILVSIFFWSLSIKLLQGRKE